VDNIYKQLARVLDRIPEGYPETESGVELKILARLFTPEEAELACYLDLEPRLSKTIAQRIGWEERQTFVCLKGMTKKGLIEAERGQGGLYFKLIPFVVGFYENQNARIDEEFAHLVEAYFNEGLYKIMSDKPAVHRVIPLETVIPLNIEVMPYQRASTYIDEAKSWGVLPCICRVQKRLIGRGCEHTEENCLVFSSRSNAFESTDAIRAITGEEARQILVNADKEGLVHSTRNVQKEVTYICNCCTCSCGILRGMAQYGQMNAVGRSDFFAVVDETLCSGCAACTDRCRFNALEVREGMCRIERSRCYGCGLCVSVCPTEALGLKAKPADEIESPPVSESRWREERSRARGTGGSNTPHTGDCRYK
jgi:electron transport complex protein RnfB